MLRVVPRVHPNAGGDVHLEAAGGFCQHHLAPDASWSYREWGDYETKMRLKPNC